MTLNNSNYLKPHLHVNFWDVFPVFGTAEVRNPNLLYKWTMANSQFMIDYQNKGRGQSCDPVIFP